MEAARSTNPVRALPPVERPREKLLFRGEEVCSDGELLAALLREGIRGTSAPDLARGLLERFGGLAGLERARPGELLAEPGMGAGRAAAVAAAFALGRRAASIPWRPEAELRTARQVFEMFRGRLGALRKERFYALLLDGKNRCLREEFVSEGTLTASLVHPREVFGPAVREGAASLIVLHNHPSGDAQPSAEDREVTRRLREAGILLGIPLLDHLVIGRDGFFSFLDQGAL